LLDFHNHQAGADRMEAAGRYEETVAGSHGELVETPLKRGAAGADGALELLPSDAAAQASYKVRVRRGIEDVPHLSLGFAAKRGGDSGRRVNLKREPLPGIEEFDQKRKARRARRSRPTDHCVGAETFNKVAKGLAGVGAVDDDGFGVVAVADFPTLADEFSGRERLSITGEGLAAPNAFDQDWLKSVRIKHV
jgi:hypothetical protein